MIKLEMPGFIHTSMARHACCSIPSVLLMLHQVYGLLLDEGCDIPVSDVILA